MILMMDWVYFFLRYSLLTSAIQNKNVSSLDNKNSEKQSYENLFLSKKNNSTLFNNHLFPDNRTNKSDIPNKESEPNNYLLGEKNLIKKDTQNYVLRYSPSIYDFLAIRKHPELFGVKGYIRKHKEVYIKNLSSKTYFGNFSIATINGRLERDTLETQQISSISTFINTHHPSIMMLQSLSQDVMITLEKRIQGHYKLSCKDYVDIDRTLMKNEFKPIIYDAEILKEIKSGKFSPQLTEKTTTYATYTTFSFIDASEIFTVINVDLYSIDPKTIEAQVLTIIKHIYESNIKNYPIIIGGTINTKTSSINKFLSKAFKNLVDSDKNNSKFSPDTFHDNGNFADGIPRDFLLLHDESDMFQLNYARILKLFDKESFKHYPIFSILTVKHKNNHEKD